MPVGPPNTRPGGPLVSGSGVATIPYGAPPTSGTIQLPGQAQQTPRQDAYGPQRPYQGDHVLFFNDSDSGLNITLPSGSSLPCPPGHILDMMVEPGDVTAQWSILYQNPYQVHPAQVLTAAFYSAADLARGYVLPSGTLNPSVPAAAIGPGALPAGVTDNNPDVFGPTTIGPGGLDTDVFIGLSSEGPLNQFVGLQSNGTMESGVFDGVSGHTVIAKGVGNIFLGLNGYFDGVSDRYITSAPAYQLNFSRTNGWRWRGSTDITPAAGAVITWGPYNVLVDTSGNRYADPGFVAAGALAGGVTLAGSQVTGDIAANQVGPGALDSDVTMLAAEVQTGAFGGSGTATFPGAIISGGAILDNDDSVNKADTIAPQVPGGSARALNFQSWDGAAAHNVLSIGTGGFQAPASFTDSGALGHLGGQAAAGSFGAPVIVAQALDVAVSATTLQTILTYAVSTSGYYRINAYVNLNNTAGGGHDMSLLVTWTDPDVGSAKNSNMVTASGILISGAVLPRNADGTSNNFVNFPYPIAPFLLHAQGGTNIICQYQDPAGTPSDGVTYIIERLA